jgi:hypothetical protein
VQGSRELRYHVPRVHRRAVHLLSIRRHLFSIVSFASFAVLVWAVATRPPVRDATSFRRFPAQSDYEWFIGWDTSGDYAIARTAVREYSKQAPLDERLELLGFMYTHWDISWGIELSPAFYGCRTMGSRLVLPAWGVFCGLSILPAWWLARFILRTRQRMAGRKAGLCLTCGYDLRATPERCPECGVVPTTGSA